MLLEKERTPIQAMSDEDRKGLIKELELKHLHEINNPRINKDDKYYHEDMILLVHEKSSWHKYYDPKTDFIYSIAVVPDSKSSLFGTKSYFKRWYNFMKHNSKNTMLCLTNKAVELLDLN